MKKIILSFMSLIFVLAFNVGHVSAVPDIRGVYSGSDTTVVSNCSNSGTYHGTLTISISTQTGTTFSGKATITYEFDAVEYIQLSGTISESGTINGSTSHTFLGTGGIGTFTGKISGNTLVIENPGQDTYGNTCSYIRNMSATLETCNIFVTDFYAPGVNSPTLTGSIMSVSPVTGNSNVISSGGLLETSPQDIEIDEQGDLIVTVNDTGSGPGEKVVRIDRVTGSQTVISQGGLIDFYIGGLAIEKNGDLIVGTSRYGGQKLIRINPQNGNQSILTKWSDPNDGPNDIAIESSGQILVAGDGSEKRGDIIYSTGAIYRVDPITGSYSIVSLGGELDELRGIAIDPRSQIFVTSWDWVGDEYKIVKVNTSTGSQSVVYKSTRYYLRGVDFDAKGDLIIAAVTSGYLSGLLLRVDPETGAEEVISSEIYYPTDVIATCNTTTPTPLKYSNAMPWIPLLLIDD